jgi:hypothetical protein
MCAGCSRTGLDVEMHSADPTQQRCVAAIRNANNY